MGEFAEAFADGQEPVLGTAMTFVLGHDTKSGRERAQDIRIGDGADVVGPAPIEGTINAWNDAKACGFIFDTTGKKWFAHKTEFTEDIGDGPNEPALVGQTVFFYSGTDKVSGRERAQMISFNGGGVEAGALEAEPVPKKARLV